METCQDPNWDTVHTVATIVVNNRRKRYLLSNEDAEDAITELTLQLMPEVSRYKAGKLSLKSWLHRRMQLRLRGVVEALRNGGMTGELDGTVTLHDYDGPAPAPRALGDPTWLPDESGATPLLRDVLATPSKQDESAVLVEQLLGAVSGEDEHLLTAYYGLDGQDPQTLSELAQAYKVSPFTIWARLQKIQNGLKKTANPASINSDKEELNAAVRDVRRAEPESGKDAGMQGMRTHHSVSRRRRVDGTRARFGTVRRKRRLDATGTGNQR